ncbi:hypothetical protein COB55_03455 [Candidatus Wolfebacteria bacterium]|nr:MAG: hypothetical protein COB55_03455 [Candidatus Wolfebacteria bacterium]
MVHKNSGKDHIFNSRLKKFYSEKEFNLEMRMGREWLEGDLNMIVVLFAIDYVKTESDDLYGESKNKHYHPPVELRVRPEIVQDSTGEYLSEDMLKREPQPKLHFSIYNLQLQEKDVEIKFGDYIGFNDPNKGLRYFEVYNADHTDLDNEKTRMGFKSYWRKISCVMVDRDVFDG